MQRTLEAQLSSALMVREELKPAEIIEALKTARPLAKNQYSAAEEALYERALNESVRYLVKVASTLPKFEESLAAESLGRLGRIEHVVQRIETRLDHMVAIPRPLLVHSVDMREIEGKLGTTTLRFTEVILVIENRGELSAEMHVPNLVIEERGMVLFDNREILRDAHVVGEIPPKTSIRFDMYRTLQQPICRICDEISFRGVWAILNRDFWDGVARPGSAGDRRTAGRHCAVLWRRDAGLP